MEVEEKLEDSGSGKRLREADSLEIQSEQLTKKPKLLKQGSCDSGVATLRPTVVKSVYDEDTLDYNGDNEEEVIASAEMTQEYTLAECTQENTLAECTQEYTLAECTQEYTLAECTQEYTLAECTQLSNGSQVFVVDDTLDEDNSEALVQQTGNRFSHQTKCSSVVVDSGGPAPDVPGDAATSMLPADMNSDEAHNSPSASGCHVNKSPLHRIGSVQRDADAIADMLQISDVDKVYNRLSAIRQQPQRVERVTNEILENGLESLQPIPTVEPDISGESQNELHSLFADVRKVISSVKDKVSTVNCDPDEIYGLLEKYANSANRVQNVVAEIISRYSKETRKDCSDVGNMPPSKGEEDGILADVTEVQKHYPKCNPNTIFLLLEEFADKPSRIALVVDKLARESTCSANAESDIQAQGDNDLDNDPVYRDTKIVATMFPNRDKNEIYAYLEAHHDKPNRVQIVTEEFLRSEQDSLDGSLDMMPTKPTLAGNACGTLTKMSSLQNDVDILRTVFTDCDPNHLYECLDELRNDTERVTKVSQMLVSQSYPKLKDRLAQESEVSKLRQLQCGRLDMEAFLLMFPEPKTTFNQEETVMGFNYKRHALTALKNEFPVLHASYIDKKFGAHNEHFYPTARELERTAATYTIGVERGRRMRRFLKRPRDCVQPMPESPDEFFYKELLYWRHEKEIEGYLQKRADDKKRRLEKAKQENALYECTCCYDDEVLFEDMSPCPEGHLFCKECVRRAAQEAIGMAKVKFPCLEENCESDYSLTTLQSVLSSRVFSLLLGKIQEEEIRQADIDDLVSCPFCRFATVMPDPDDKVFKCLNPECLKESCRLCKEPSHVPLRCDEVEKDSEKSMRAYIENKMSEAMLRTCWKCKKRYYKTEGCNKMTCTCGASMCYVCREPIEDYDHFNDNQGCAHGNDIYLLHRREMEKAAEDARREYEADHPDMAGKALKFEPLDHIKKLAETAAAGHVEPNDDDGSDQYAYEDDDEADEDYDYI